MIAFLFPGQGSQSIGMLGDIAQKFVEIKKTFSEASDVLQYDLWELIQKGPAEKLDNTEYTQPALLAASVAIFRIINFRPVMMAGHSLGEYTALVCADALHFSDAIKLVAARGRYMQDAVPKGIGGLAAIVGLDDAVVDSICKKVVAPGEVLTPANFNCPGQVVISGHLSAIEKAITLAKEMKALLAKLLPVSVPSHSLLMKPAAERLQEDLKKLSIQSPTIPVLNNVDVAIYENADQIRDGLTRQLFMPVRWVEIIREFSKKNINCFVECGPGKVLSGLNRRIVQGVELVNTNDCVSVENFIPIVVQDAKF